jgi:hypothetical protein
MAGVNRVAVDALTEQALEAGARAGALAPAPLRLLLRHYAATGREDVRAALEVALARGLDIARDEGERARRGEWLALFVEAGRLSDDDRVGAVCQALAADLQQDWPRCADVASAMRGIEPCLEYGLVQPALDELERIVGAAYHPGRGVEHSASDPSAGPGTLDDQVSTASALLTSHAVTGRLPYAMLAEELVRYARQVWWADGFRGESTETRCAVVRVLCRLARLHADDEYRRAAVVGEGDFAGDAELTLASLEPGSGRDASSAAVHALAALEWLALRS